MEAPVAPGGTLRIVQNGSVVWTHELTPDERSYDATLELPLDDSSWFAARLDGTERIPAGDLAVAHTSPIYVRLNGREAFVPEARDEVFAMLPSIEAIRSSGNSTSEEREIAIRWATEARASLEQR